MPKDADIGDGWTVELHPHPELPMGRVRDDSGRIRFDVYPLGADGRPGSHVAMIDAVDRGHWDTFWIDAAGTRFQPASETEVKRVSDVGVDVALLKLCRDAGLRFPRLEV